VFDVDITIFPLLALGLIPEVAVTDDGILILLALNVIPPAYPS
jgi:hypothetical protein